MPPSVLDRLLPPQHLLLGVIKSLADALWPSVDEPGSKCGDPAVSKYYAVSGGDCELVPALVRPLTEAKHALAWLHCASTGLVMMMCSTAAANVRNVR